MKQTQAISHAIKPQEKALYQRVTSLTVHPGASYPLFSVSRVCASTPIRIAILGVLNGLPSKHVKVFYALGATKHPNVKYKSNERLYNLGKRACHKTRMTTGLRSDQQLTSN